MVGRANDVKQHRWFKQILWTDVMERRIQVRKIEFLKIKYTLIRILCSRQSYQKSIIPVTHKILNYLMMNFCKHQNVQKKNVIYLINFKQYICINLLVIEDNPFSLSRFFYTRQVKTIVDSD